MQNALSAFIGFAVALLVLGPKSGYATIITLDAVDSGHYANRGGHSVWNQNYVSGRSTFVAELHNFLVFDLSGVTDTIIAAELRAYNPALAVEGDSGNGFQSADSTETYELFSVETSIAILTAGTGGTSAFADLADGTSYGTRVFSIADNGTLVSIALNASALADLNAATDLFALGGTVTNLAVGGGLEFVFGFTGGPTGGTTVSDTTRQLVLTTGSTQMNRTSICHKGKRTITISWNAVSAHLGHGDISGACPTLTTSPMASVPTKRPPLASSALKTFPMKAPSLKVPTLKGQN